MTRKSATGIGEMLGNLMNSSAFAETAARMDSIQSPRPHLSVAVAPVSVSEPVVSEPEVSDISLDQPNNTTSAPSTTTTSTTESTTDITGNQTGKQTIKQSSKSPSKQAGKQVSKQAIKQTGEQTPEPTSEPATKQASEPATEQVSNHLVQQPDEQQGRQLDQHPEEQPVHQAFQQVVEQPDQQPAKQPVAIKSVEEDFLSLTSNQSSLLTYLFNAGGLTNMEQICGDTGIAYGTARSALAVLQREGYVTGKKQFNGHTFRGFSYTLNNNLCQMYFSRSVQQPAQQPFRQADQQVSRHPFQSAGGQAGKQAGNSIEEGEEFKENLLTSSEPVIGGIDLDGPELGWWASVGLTVAKTAEWLRVFKKDGLNAKDLSNSLKYAWFDATINKVQPQGRPIGNYFNWFFAYLPGGYPAPVNYKSYNQVLIEKERQELEEIERERNELVELRKRKLEAQKELAFQKLLLDPESKEYQALYAKVSGFAKEAGEEALIYALRDAFFA